MLVVVGMVVGGCVQGLIVRKLQAGRYDQADQIYRSVYCVNQSLIQTHTHTDTHSVPPKT